jgi:hypothetical protein
MSWFWCWYQPFRPCKLYGTCNQTIQFHPISFYPNK